MLATNREYLRRKSNTALENLSMLHSSFDEFTDEACVLGLALNDSIAAMVFQADYKRAIQISQKALDRFPDSDYMYLVASHHMVIGRCLTFQLDYTGAFRNLHRAEDIAFDVLQPGEESRLLRADVRHEIGMTLMQAGGEKEEGVRFFEKALRVLGDKGYQSRRGVFIMAIGNVRFSQGRYEDALNHYMKAETLLEGTDSYYNLSTLLCNLGVCHMCLATFQIAETYLIRSLELRLKTGTYGEIAGSYYNLAALYDRKGEAEKAYKTMLLSRDYAMVSQVRELHIRTIRELEAMAESMGDHTALTKHRAQLSEMGVLVA